MLTPCHHHADPQMTRGLGLANPLQHFKTIGPRHHDIQYHAIELGGVCLQNFDCFFSVIGAGNCVSLSFQSDLKLPNDMFLVIADKDLESRRISAVTYCSFHDTWLLV